MSRSGYVDGCDMDHWDFIRWRGAVKAAIRGKRGQALLREMETALLAMPIKELCAKDFANAETGQVCALGSVALKRKLDKGTSLELAMAELDGEFPAGVEAEEVSDEFNISGALAKEITWVNDDEAPRDPKGRYEYVLKWVRENLKKTE